MLELPVIVAMLALWTILWIPHSLEKFVQVRTFIVYMAAVLSVNEWNVCCECLYTLVPEIAAWCYCSAQLHWGGPRGIQADICEEVSLNEEMDKVVCGEHFNQSLAPCMCHPYRRNQGYLPMWWSNLWLQNSPYVSATLLQWSRTANGVCVWSRHML